MGNIKKGYITLLSTIDYLEAVLVLNRSLKKVKSKYPLIAATTPKVFQNKEIISILEKENIIIEPVPWIEYNKETKENLSAYGIKSIFNVGSKIEIFGLTQYEKLVYIDADALVVKNIDSLFKKKDGSTLVDESSGNKCFCALFVFCPSNHPIDYYRSILKHECANDGTLMEKLWWQTIDNKEYIISPKFFLYPYWNNDWVDGSIKAYHLQNQELKFWKMNQIPNTKLGRVYQKFLEEIRTEYNTRKYSSFFF